MPQHFTHRSKLKYVTFENMTPAFAEVQASAVPCPDAVEWLARGFNACLDGIVGDGIALLNEDPTQAG